MNTIVNLTGTNIYMRGGDEGIERVQLVSKGKLMLSSNDETNGAISETMLVLQSDRSYVRCRTYISDGPTLVGALVVMPPDGRGICTPFDPLPGHEYVVSNELILELLHAKQASALFTGLLPIMTLLAPMHDVANIGAVSNNALTFLRRYEI